MLEFLWDLPEPEDREVSTGGAWGVIFIRTEYGDFPAYKWDDFMISTLSNWIANAANAKAQLQANPISEACFDNYFLDGPFMFSVKSISKSKDDYDLLIDFIEFNKVSRNILYSINISLEEYSLKIYIVGKIMLQTCSDIGYGEVTEMESLRNNCARLSALMK